MLHVNLPQFRSVPKHLRYNSNVRRRASPMRVQQRRAAQRRGSMIQSLRAVDWVRMFRVVSMVLFIGYPSVSIKLFRLFRCINVAGVYYLFDDMRLQCYTAEWSGYAIYAITMIGLYVVGLPLGILVLLYRHRATLFGPDSSNTMRKYGFLYDSYGASAWFWEVEELVRKLLLTAVPVLFDPGNPLQVRASRAASCSTCCIGAYEVFLTRLQTRFLLLPGWHAGTGRSLSRCCSAAGRTSCTACSNPGAPAQRRTRSSTCPCSPPRSCSPWVCCSK